MPVKFDRLLGQPVRKPRKFKVRSAHCQFSIRNGNGCSLLKNCMETRPWWVQSIESLGHRTDFEWRPTSDNFDFSAMLPSKRGQLVRCLNHFQHHAVLSNKAQMYRTLTGESSSPKCLDFLPPTFVFNAKSPAFAADLATFVDGFERRSARLDRVFDRGHNLWIVKPAAFARGCGLEIVKSREELMAVVQAYLTGYKICEFSKHQNDAKAANTCHQDRLRAMASDGRLGEPGLQPVHSRKTKLNFVTMEFPVVLHPHLANSPYIREVVRHKKAASPQR